MPARKSTKVAGRDDAQVFILKCPVDQEVVEVCHYVRGSLDKIRGIHHVRQYGWYAVCKRCGQQWGSEEDPTVAPSLWVLSDLVQESK